MRMSVDPWYGMCGLIILSGVDASLLIVSCVDSGEALLVDSVVYICCQGPWWWPAKREEPAPAERGCLSASKHIDLLQKGKH